MARGNDVLGHLFGSKDVSRAVAHSAASRSGLDPTLLKKMLPLLAMVVAGSMAKQRSAPGSSGLGGMLGGLLSGGQPAKGVGWAGLIDADGDGNPLDDILRMAGKVMG